MDNKKKKELVVATCEPNKNLKKEKTDDCDNKDYSVGCENLCKQILFNCKEQIVDLNSIDDNNDVKIAEFHHRRFNRTFKIPSQKIDVAFITPNYPVITIQQNKFR